MVLNRCGNPLQTLLLLLFSVFFRLRGERMAGYARNTSGFSKDFIVADFKLDKWCQAHGECLKRADFNLFNIHDSSKLFLVADGEYLRFEDRNDKERKRNDCQFKLNLYLDSCPNHGSAVMLTVSNKGENMIICCCENGGEKTVSLKRQVGDLPIWIPGSSHEAIFLLIERKGRNCVKLKSSQWPKWVLTSKAEGDEHVKLVLTEDREDEEDELYLVNSEI